MVQYLIKISSLKEAYETFRKEMEKLFLAEVSNVFCLVVFVSLIFTAKGGNLATWRQGVSFSFGVLNPDVRFQPWFGFTAVEK